MTDSFGIKAEPTFKVNDYVDDFENRERSEIRRKAAVINFYDRKKSLDSQRATHAKFVKEHVDQENRFPSPLNGEAPEPQKLPNLITHELPYADERMNKYIQALSPRDGTTDDEKPQNATLKSSSNLISCLKTNRLDTGRSSQGKLQNYLSFDRREQPSVAEKFK